MTLTTAPGAGGVLDSDGVLGTARDDQLDLHERLIGLFFNRAFGGEPTAIWNAPAPLTILGGGVRGPTLTLPTRWRAMVAGRAREDADIRMYLLESPDEPVRFSPLEPDPERELPEVARMVLRVAQALRAAGCPPAGADLLTYGNLPDGVGPAVRPALLCAVAQALVGVSGSASSATEVLAALGTLGPETALCPASLLGTLGSVVLLPAGPSAGGLEQVPFDPRASRMRLVAISLRAGPGAGPPTEWDPGAGEGSLAPAGFAVLSGPQGVSAGPRLGALLSAAHQASRAAREPVAADDIVPIAVGAGAFGARSISSRSALAVVPTPLVPTVRAAVTHWFAEHRASAPRFLTTAGLPLQEA